MKFTYYSLAAASAVSSLEISDFNVSNIKLVENSINSKLSQKQNLKKSKTRQILETFNRQVRSVAAQFDEDYHSCRLQNANQFWTNCKQCLVQECTSYYIENCGGKANPLVRSMIKQSDNVDPTSSLTSLADFVEYFNSLNGEIQLVLDESDFGNGGITVERISLDEAAKKRRRNKRNTLEECGFATLECTGDDCHGFDIQSRYEINCMDYNRFKNQPQPYMDDYEFVKSVNAKEGEAWDVLGGSSRNFEISTQLMSKDGKTMVLIDLTAALNNFTNVEVEIDPEPNNPFNPEEYFDEAKYSSGFVTDELTQLQQLDNIFDYSDDNTKDKKNPDLEIGTFTVEQEGEPPCEDDLGSEVIEAENTIPDFDNTINQKLVESITNGELIDLTEEEFCKLLYGGKCPSDDKTVKRSSQILKALRLKRSVQMKKSKSENCEKVLVKPEWCQGLRYRCDECTEDLNKVCPEYVSSLRKLSKALAFASSLVENFDSTSSNDHEELVWSQALDNPEGGASAYLQKATFDPNTNQVDLVFKILRGEEARNVLVRGTWPKGLSLSEFRAIVSDQVANNAKVFDWDM